MIVYVLKWRCSDGSADGIEAAYLSQDTAVEMCRLLSNHSYSTWQVIAVKVSDAPMTAREVGR